MKWEFKHPSIKWVGLLHSGDVFNLQIKETLSCDDSDGKESPVMQETWVQSLGWEDHWRREWQPTAVCLPGNSHRQRGLVCYTPWGHKELDTTERLHFHFFTFSCAIDRGLDWKLQSSAPLSLKSMTFPLRCYFLSSVSVPSDCLCQ